MCLNVQKRGLAIASSFLLTAFWGGNAATAAAPLLYHQTFLQSPVNAARDDLLLIAGDGFKKDDRVVYQRVTGIGAPQHPHALPGESSSTLGLAEVVSSADTPHSLTIRLPNIADDVAYDLFAVTARNEWSEGVRINDARPLWFSPAYVYSSMDFASLGRYIKVIGRNLQPVPGGITRIRLQGPREFVLKSRPAALEDRAVDQYAAVADLPAGMPPGAYRVQVSRDQVSWIEVSGQTLEVRPDAVQPRRFDVANAEYGGCKPDGGRDATGCVLRAIAAAKAEGGGMVYFGAGTWTLSETTSPQPNGIVLPVGVGLLGEGILATVILQAADDAAHATKITFTLLGGNHIEGLTFRDAHRYSTWSGNVFFKLGIAPQETDLPPARPSPVDDVVITGNRFDRPNVAIGDAGIAITRLFISNNEFGAYRDALDLTGNRFLVNQVFTIDDAVITHNIFKPGSYLDVAIRQGTIASEIGGSSRMDFSHNTADGAATDMLNSPNDPRGWRAAFFWSLSNDQEMLFVSQNTATCTGDKAGDGEAFAFDNNANTFALSRAATVVTATADSITIDAPLAARQNDRDIRIGNYYQDHWIQVGEGPGLGQARKIRSYSEDRASGRVTFLVTPAWDVIPVKGKTRVSVGREFWQLYVIANRVDERQPLCAKSNRTDTKAGGIVLWAQSADSVIAGNRQFDTDGILFQQFYNAEEDLCTVCHRETYYTDFLEIRDNDIEGEYRWDDDCSSSGIFGSIGAGPTPHSSPPTVSFGVSISHNTIDHADGMAGGAISMMPTWFQGPPPQQWALVDATLIYKNNLLGLSGAAAKGCKAATPHARTGISLSGSPLFKSAVLYANTCPNANRPVDLGNNTAVVCPADAQSSCGCAP
jgi:hypothetical protein